MKNWSKVRQADLIAEMTVTNISAETRSVCSPSTASPSQELRYHTLWLPAYYRNVYLPVLHFL